MDKVRVSPDLSRGSWVGMGQCMGLCKTLTGIPYLQGESAQAQLQKAQEQQQALAAQLQETLDQAEKQRHGLEARLQLHVQQEFGLIAVLAQDFTLSSELQQRLSAEGEAHASAVQELRNQVILCCLDACLTLLVWTPPPPTHTHTYPRAPAPAPTVCPIRATPC